MPGLVPGIHVFAPVKKTWMAGHMRAEATPFFERLWRGHDEGRIAASPRRNTPELSIYPSPKEGVGNAGCPSAPAASRGKNKNHTSVVTAGTRRNHPAFPHANGFNGFLRALPGEPGCLSPSPAQRVSVVAVLTPASGRQDHTTSPYASTPIRLFGATASTASRSPTFVTIAKRPS